MIQQSLYWIFTPKDMKTHIQKDICTLMFIAALVIVARTWNQPMIDDWLKKLWYIYKMEYYAALRRDEILPFGTTWMGLKIITLSEISQTDHV